MSEVLMKACQILDDDLYSRLLLMENITLEITSRITRWRNYVTQLDSSSNELANLNSVLSEMVRELVWVIVYKNNMLGPLILYIVIMSRKSKLLRHHYIRRGFSMLKLEVLLYCLLYRKRI